jgi:hypothetical protein
MVRMPNRIVAAALLMCLLGCSPAVQPPQQGKISAFLSARLAEDNSGAATYEIVVTLSDTTGIRGEFPSLSFPNRQVALGHLTKEQIYSLSLHTNVLSIDHSKIFRPQ